MKQATENIAIVLLAAGASTRMGFPKQLLKTGHETLIEKMTAVACSAGGQPVIVVLGAFYEAVAEKLDSYPVTILKNDRWQEGMGSTVACAFDFLRRQHPETAASVIMLCDQPHLNPAVLRRLINQWKSSGKPIVASEYGETYGAPALFDSTLFEALAKLKGEKGAKTIMAVNKENMEFIAFPKGKIDLDTPENWANYRR